MPATLGDTPTFGTPVALFPVQLTSNLFGATRFDDINVTPDGQRFLVTQQTVDSTDNPVVVTVNWPSALAGRAGDRGRIVHGLRRSLIPLHAWVSP